MSVLATFLLVGWEAASKVSTFVGGSEQAAARPGAVQVVRPLGVERAIQHYLLARWQHQISRVEAHVIAPRKKIRLPDGQLSVCVKPRPVVLRPTGTLFDVTFMVDGVLVQDLRVAATVRAYAEVVLTTRNVERGEILRAEDLASSEWRICATEHGLIVSPEEAIGKRIKVAIPTGIPIPRVALDVRD